MLNIHKLSIAFQGENLFEEITFRLNAGDRVGLVGKNGAGKSTLLKILAGDLESSAGQIAAEKDLKIGFLRQDIDFEEGRTVLEEAYQAFTEIKRLEKQLEKINTQLAERTDYESEGYHQLMVDLNDVQHQYEIHGGYNYQGDTERILQGLGFEREGFHKKTDTFSGGWRMRIELAKLLLQNNDVLLLDEPTNHLDIESIIWLEGFLKNYSGCVVIVSHDKMFLDQVTNRTIEISLGKIYDYNKPYSEYLVQRKELKEKQLAAHKNQQKQIAHTEKLIDKFRAKASKATMAQSLIKKLDKVERVEIDEEDNSVMSVNFPVSVVPGKTVLEAEKLSKSYGEKNVLQNVDLRIDRNEKIAFVGQNGQGKSTLAKMMVGEIDFQGKLKRGHNVQIAYFAQNQAEYLDGKKTVLDTMIDAANGKNRSKVRDILGAFLFRGEEVEKYVRVLSGGERNRLALAKLLLQPLNFLIMDEPTNHLDIQSKNVLKEALKNFEGTMVLVSHDRDFLQGLTDKTYEFKDHKIKEYLGDIDFYLEQREIQHLRDAERKSKTKKPQAPNPPAGRAGSKSQINVTSNAVEKPNPKNPKATEKNTYKDRKKLKSLNNKLIKVEAEIGKLEREIGENETEMAENYDETLARENFFSEYQTQKKRLDELMERWEEIQLRIQN